MSGGPFAWLWSRGERRRRRKYRQWQAQGRAGPAPSAVKQAAIVAYARRHAIEVLIETGVHRGNTVAAVKHAFRRVFTIELDPELCRAARARFGVDGHVTVLEGDSGQVLPRLLKDITEPAVLWLDGHYSGPGTARAPRETPIAEELAAVLAHPVREHVVLIDDARVFGVDPEYPSLEEVAALVRRTRPDLTFEVRDDIIRITPGPP